MGLVGGFALDRFLRVDLGIFAAHHVQSGWEIIAPSDDPYTPAYWRVAVVEAGDHDDKAARDGQDHQHERVRC
jgi:hypothetical protein